MSLVENCVIKLISSGYEFIWLVLSYDLLGVQDHMVFLFSRVNNWFLVGIMNEIMESYE